jgi:uncharacterized protein YbjT (DUF2867 family)
LLLASALADIDSLVVIPANSPQQAQVEQGIYRVAAEMGVRRVVKLSAAGASAQSPATGLRLHAQAEAALAASGVDHTIVRPTFFMQNLLAQAVSISDDHVFYLPAGAARVALTDVEDLADFIAHTLDDDQTIGRAYNLTGPESLSFVEVAAQLSEQVAVCVGQGLRQVGRRRGQGAKDSGSAAKPGKAVGHDRAPGQDARIRRR